MDVPGGWTEDCTAVYASTVFVLVDSITYDWLLMSMFCFQKALEMKWNNQKGLYSASTFHFAVDFKCSKYPPS